MNNFFENHIEEINLISNRSKKEARTTISRLQKATIFNLSLINENILVNNIKSLEGINIHQHTDQGHTILGSSDRMYLPDVATRLYQGLDSILNSYKSHKVHKGSPKPKYFEENLSFVENLDISEWDADYFAKLITDLYVSLDDNLRKTFDIHFDLEGQYSFWTLFNTDGRNVEFDEFSLILFYSMNKKGSSETLMNGSIAINPGDIRNHRVNVEEIKSNLEFYGEVILKELKTVNKDSITPELVYADCNAASEMIVEMLNDNRANGVKYKRNSNQNDIHENFDKFGNKICIENESILRQSLFNSKPTHNSRNIQIECDGEETENLYDLENLVQQLRQKTKKQKFLILLGTKNRSSEETNHDSNILEPGLKIYFDGNNFSHVDFDFLDYSDLQEVEIEKSSKSNIVNHKKSKSKFSVSGLANALFSISEKVKLI